MNELAFDLPALPFTDLTAIDLDGHLPNGDVLGLIVVREPIPEGHDLRIEVKEHVAREAKRLLAFTLLGERESTIAGAPAVEICARWRDGRAALYTREAHVSKEGMRLVFAMTTLLKNRDACDAIIDDMLDTLELRERG